MSPEDVPAEWVEAAGLRVYDEECCLVSARVLRLALAAVLPEALAEAWAKGYAASDYEAYHLGTHGRTDNPYREGSES